MKFSNIFICGNFGYKNERLNGQTVKTRVMKSYINKIIGNQNVKFVDTSYVKDRPYHTIKSIKNQFKESSHIVMMPDVRAFSVLLPLYVLWNKGNKKDIRYVVTGGWLPGFLKKYKIYIHLLKKIDGIYVQAKQMDEELKELGLENVKVFPNYREFNFTPTENRVVTNELKLVYYSRVLREKGIEIAIEAVEKINRDSEYNSVVKLDIYGQIQSSYEKRFEVIMSERSKDIQYKGVLKPEGAYNILSEYDLMVFPTFFTSEGFPGAVLDAYISGVPVLASDWLYNKEFVKEGITGWLFKPQNVDDLVYKISQFLVLDKSEKENILSKMRKNCVSEASKYHVDKVIPVLLNDMGISSEA